MKVTAVVASALLGHVAVAENARPDSDGYEMEKAGTVANFNMRYLPEEEQVEIMVTTKD